MTRFWNYWSPDAQEANINSDIGFSWEQELFTVFVLNHFCWGRFICGRAESLPWVEGFIFMFTLCLFLVKDCAHSISLLLINNPGTPIKKISGDGGINAKMLLLKWLNHLNDSNWKAFLGGLFLINALQDFSYFIPCLYLAWIAFLKSSFPKAPHKTFCLRWIIAENFCC